MILLSLGKPLPPTGLQLNTVGRELETYNFILNWTPPRTLFDETDGTRQEPYYIVYTYYMMINSSLASLLSKNETISSPYTMTLKTLTQNLTICNLSAVFFYVSAKFDEVGEGNVSSPVPIVSNDAEEICTAGEYLVIIWLEVFPGV